MENLDFTESNQVKITRKSVKATILVSKLTVRSNYLLSLIFNLASQNLKSKDWQYLPASHTGQ
jgi:farnesyl-diphosphate farnesyltransferase